MRKSVGPGHVNLVTYSLLRESIVSEVHGCVCMVLDTTNVLAFVARDHVLALELRHAYI